MDQPTSDFLELCYRPVRSPVIRPSATYPDAPLLLTLSPETCPMKTPPHTAGSFAKYFGAPGNKALTVVLALATLVGCQGLSSSHSSTRQPPSPVGQLTLSSSTLDFGNVVVGGNKTLTITATNSGNASVAVTSATSSAPEFSPSGPGLPLTIAAGQSATLSITFTPAAATKASGTLSISSNAANGSVSVALCGTGLPPGQLQASPASISFGAVTVGSTQTKSTTLTNAGGSDVTISQAAVSGAGFQLAGLSVPLTLTPGQTTSFSIAFTPQSNGQDSGTISLTTSVSTSAPQAQLRYAAFEISSASQVRSAGASANTVTIDLSGSAISPGVLSVAPASMSFVNVEVGTNQSQPATLTNSGGSTVTVSQAAVSGSGFSLVGLTLPLTLTAGQSASFDVVFTPQSAGTSNGNVAFTSNASNPALTVPLSGAGLAPGSLTVTPTSVSFGSVQVGSSQQQLATLTNTGGSSVTISQATATGTGFSLSGLNLPATLGAGQSASVTVTFAPQSAGSATGSVTITSNAPNPTLVLPLSGTGTSPGTLTANPTSLGFGSVQVGNSQNLSEVVTNTGGSNVTISQDTVSGAGFSVSGFTPPVTLTPGQSYTFSLSFAPQSAGNVSGNLALVSSASNPTLSIPLSGTGTAAGQLTVSPTTLNFNNVVVGTNSVLQGTLNATAANVTVASASSSNPEFVFSGLSFPVTIQAGKTATYSVTFTPQATGTANATLTFTSNASNSPTVQSLTGNGTAPPPHSVALSWTKSTSSNIASYNIYRGTSPGSYSKIASVLAPSTAYTDSSVTHGQTYYYVTTAVDSSNQESTYSNQATAVIPSP
jgi:Abnormal spindle-like microcephaly-assoc'd, ASPM-SPD-2-Hydin/Cep192 domain 4/HYDIN/CFA65/VesB-like, Ig-like domain